MSCYRRCARLPLLRSGARGPRAGGREVRGGEATDIHGENVRRARCPPLSFFVLLAEIYNSQRRQLFRHTARCPCLARSLFVSVVTIKCSSSSSIMWRRSREVHHLARLTPSSHSQAGARCLSPVSSGQLDMRCAGVRGRSASSLSRRSISSLSKRSTHETKLVGARAFSRRSVSRSGIPGRSEGFGYGQG